MMKIKIENMVDVTEISNAIAQYCGHDVTKAEKVICEILWEMARSMSFANLDFIIANAHRRIHMWED